MTEAGYLMHYECPECGHEWREEWSCACDDDCPDCGARHIEPLAWVETEGEDASDDPDGDLDHQVARCHREMAP